MTKEEAAESALERVLFQLYKTNKVIYTEVLLEGVEDEVGEDAPATADHVGAVWSWYQSLGQCTCCLWKEGLCYGDSVIYNTLAS